MNAPAKGKSAFIYAHAVEFAKTIEMLAEKYDLRLVRYGVSLRHKANFYKPDESEREAIKRALSESLGDLFIAPSVTAEDDFIGTNYKMHAGAAVPYNGQRDSVSQEVISLGLLIIYLKRDEERLDCVNIRMRTPDILNAIRFYPSLSRCNVLQAIDDSGREDVDFLTHYVYEHLKRGDEC